MQRKTLQGHRVLREAEQASQFTREKKSGSRLKTKFHKQCFQLAISAALAPLTYSAKLCVDTGRHTSNEFMQAIRWSPLNDWHIQVLKQNAMQQPRKTFETTQTIKVLRPHADNSLGRSIRTVTSELTE